jgi:WD40 repeat protein
VNSVRFSADGKTLFSGSSDGTVKVWNVATHRVKTTLEATPAEVRSVAISSGGTTLAAGIRYGRVKVWTAPDWKESLSFKSHDADVWVVAFHPKNSVLITGDGDWNRPGQVKFWNTTTGSLLGQVSGSGEVLALACSPDGRYVAVGCWSKKLEVWEVPDAVAPGK